MYTSGNLLQVRVVLEGVQRETRNGPATSRMGRVLALHHLSWVLHRMVLSLGFSSEGFSRAAIGGVRGTGLWPSGGAIRLEIGTSADRHRSEPLSPGWWDPCTHPAGSMTIRGTQAVLRLLLAVWGGCAGDARAPARKLSIPPLDRSADGLKRIAGNTRGTWPATLSFRCQQPSNLAATNKRQPSHPVI